MCAESDVENISIVAQLVSSVGAGAISAASGISFFSMGIWLGLN